MILTKPTLKELLNYAVERIDITKTEKQLHRELKCALFEYELFKSEDVYNDIFTKFLNLCIIKYD